MSRAVDVGADAGAVLAARLTTDVLLADGATGTLLYSLGFDFGECFDALCESEPDRVREVHERYVAAGARLIETNTFGANALRLAEHGLRSRVRDINLAGARIARSVADAAADPVWVAGSIGPLGASVAPLGKVSAEEARRAFAQQARALAEGGVDLLMVETMPHLREALIALEAAKAETGLPVAVLMTFGDDGLTVSGRSPEEVAVALQDAGADIIGANCSTGPAQMLDVVLSMAAVARVPLAAMPNAGLPAVVGDRYLYTASPAYMAGLSAEMVEAGVALIGGCCGSTPEHIMAMRMALDEREAAAGPRDAGARSPSPLGVVRQRGLGGAIGHRAEGGAGAGIGSITAPSAGAAGAGIGDALGPTGLQRALASRFAVVVEVDPPREFDAGAMLAALQPLAESGVVDAFSVSDSPQARPHASALATSALIRARLEVETLLHMSCRHRNLVALHADLMGAHALGIRDVLAEMGELPAQGDYPNATVVHDVTDIQLMEILKDFNAGRAPAGRRLSAATAFHVGCSFRFCALDLEREVEQLLAKVEAGASFALSDPLYDVARFEAALDLLGGTFPVPLLVGILPLDSARHADYLHHEVPGIELPEALLQRMKSGPEGAEGAGLDEALAIIDAVRGKVAGIHIMPPFGRTEAALALLKRLEGASAVHQGAP